MKYEEEILEGLIEAGNRVKTTKEDSEERTMLITIICTLEWALDLDDHWEDTQS